MTQAPAGLHQYPQELEVIAAQVAFGLESAAQTGYAYQTPASPASTMTSSGEEVRNLTAAFEKHPHGLPVDSPVPVKLAHRDAPLIPGDLEPEIVKHITAIHSMDDEGKLIQSGGNETLEEKVATGSTTEK